MDNMTDFFPVFQPDDEDTELLSSVADIFTDAAKQLIEATPEGFEQTKMVERLREAFFWANSAIFGEV